MKIDTHYVGNATITLAIQGRGKYPNKTAFAYSIALPDTGRIYLNADLEVLEQDSDDATLIKAYGALLSFLGAAAESYRATMGQYADDADGNANLFPKHVTEWAYQYDSEIDYARFELEEANSDY